MISVISDVASGLDEAWNLARPQMRSLPEHASYLEGRLPDIRAVFA